MNLILIGFMGSGKTVIGKRLASILNYSWQDTDALILKKTNLSSIKEIFRLKGELFFRESEILVCKELQRNQNTIISTGGGVIQNKICLDYLWQNGSVVVHLDVRFDVAIERIGSNLDRPLINDLKIARELYDLRAPLYKAFSDFTIDTNNCSEHAISEKILYLTKTKCSIYAF
jgi:shikimate kinase